MKLNLLFLLIGLVLSAVSKLIQFVFKSKLGDLVVIPAAVFFVLAVLFSIESFTGLAEREHGAAQMAVLAVLACSAVVLFQVMMILVVGHHNKWGLVCILPILIAAGLFVKRWMALFHA